MIYDSSFLQDLELQQNQIIYGKIIALSSEERELEEITGYITKGTVNVDGKSSIRRTCSLSIVTSNLSITDYLWTLTHKFKLLIGIQNEIDPTYDSIIWFPQGTFVITSFANSVSTSASNITIQGRDKMCLLNGEFGGNFSSEVDFGQLEVEENNTITNIKLPLKKIIREMIHQYGKEPFQNIIINDLDDTGLELLEYRLEQPLYLWRPKDSQEFTNGTLDGKTPIYYINNNNKEKINIDSIPIYDPLLTTERTQQLIPTEIYLTDKADASPHYVTKIEYGDTAGYRETELIYPDKLIAKQGSTITQILDKIKKVLVFYEYFYNVDGQFVFQKKKNEKEITELVNVPLLTSVNISPSLKSVKNDFTIWGKRKTVNSQEVPIHMRWAIQKRPVEYTSIEVSNEELEPYNKAYGLKTRGQKSVTYKASEYDWRELIYQMALDYHKYNHLDNFNLKISKANPIYFPTGITGYEQYYIDLQGFWRQLYCPNEILNPSPQDINYSYPWGCGKESFKEEYISILQEQGRNVIQVKGHPKDELYYTVKLPIKTIESGTNYLFSCSLKTGIKPVFFYTSKGGKKEIPVSFEWQKFSNEFQGFKLDGNPDFICFESEDYFQFCDCLVLNKDFSNQNTLYWNKEFFNHPENFNFYFDLIDKGEIVESLATNLIGDRTKVNNNNHVKAIFYRETPQIIFGKPLKELKTGYRYFQIDQSNFENTFSISFQGKSAEDELKFLLNQSYECLESISIKTIPLYHLQPNTQLYINDECSGINGYYNVLKYNLSLDAQNISMNISASKDIQEIF